MESKIIFEEVVGNEDRKFGSNKLYYPCRIEDGKGRKRNALFTSDQLKVAMERANRNLEDIPDKSFWEILFG